MKCDQFKSKFSLPPVGAPVESCGLCSKNPNCHLPQRRSTDDNTRNVYTARMNTQLVTIADKQPAYFAPGRSSRDGSDH